MERVIAAIKRNRYLFILALFGIVVLVELTLVSPMVRRATVARAGAGEMTARILGINGEYSQMKQALALGTETLDDAAPVTASGAVPAFLEETAQYGRKCGVTIYKVVPENAVQELVVRSSGGSEITYVRQRLTVYCTATYVSLGEFLGQLEDGPLRTFIDRMELRKTSEESAELDVTLIVSLYACR